MLLPLPLPIEIPTAGSIPSTTSPSFTDLLTETLGNVGDPSDGTEDLLTQLSAAGDALEVGTGVFSDTLAGIADFDPTPADTFSAAVDAAGVAGDVFDSSGAIGLQGAFPVVQARLTQICVDFGAAVAAGGFNSGASCSAATTPAPVGGDGSGAQPPPVQPPPVQPPPVQPPPSTQPDPSLAANKSFDFGSVGGTTSSHYIFSTSMIASGPVDSTGPGDVTLGGYYAIASVDVVDAGGLVSNAFIAHVYNPYPGLFDAIAMEFKPSTQGQLTATLRVNWAAVDPASGYPQPSPMLITVTALVTAPPPPPVDLNALCGAAPVRSDYPAGAEGLQEWEQDTRDWKACMAGNS